MEPKRPEQKPDSGVGVLVLADLGYDAQQLKEMHHELLRERGLRERCYRKWVDEGRLSQLSAEEQFNRHAMATELLKKLLDTLPVADEVPF